MFSVSPGRLLNPVHNRGAENRVDAKVIYPHSVATQGAAERRNGAWVRNWDKFEGELARAPGAGRRVNGHHFEPAWEPARAPPRVGPRCRAGVRPAGAAGPRRTTAARAPVYGSRASRSHFAGHRA